jgi:hypothetical protein
MRKARSVTTLKETATRLKDTEIRLKAGERG